MSDTLNPEEENLAKQLAALSPEAQARITTQASLESNRDISITVDAALSKAADAIGRLELDKVVDDLRQEVRKNAKKIGRWGGLKTKAAKAGGGDLSDDEVSAITKHVKGKCKGEAAAQTKRIIFAACGIDGKRTKESWDTLINSIAHKKDGTKAAGLAYYAK
jgi:hypothetical protein